MHDVSVAQAIADEVLKRLGGKRPEEIGIELVLGSLRFHDTEQVEFWLNEIMGRELGKSVKITLKARTAEPRIRCRCGYIGKVEDVGTTEELAHHGVYEMKCPKCGSKEYEITSGDECLLKKVTIS
jgi:Zn finger protein HypA/HybF involved in hydrogenase expression